MTPLEEEKIEAYANCKAKLEVFGKCAQIAVWLQKHHAQLALEFRTSFLSDAFNESEDADKEYKPYL